jgi:hypothetical protein
MKSLFFLAKYFWRTAESGSQRGFHGDLQAVQLFKNSPVWFRLVRVGQKDTDLLFA